MKVRVSTRQYRSSHSISPRGKGLWAFGIGEGVYYIQGTYTETKKVAVQVARNEGYDLIEVLP